jgi:5-methylcytosine-specific restriction protein B
VVEASVLESIQAALATWDRGEVENRVKEADSLRTAFVEKFPLAGWAEMPLERYALGQQVEGGSFSWWVEFKTRPVGSMSGGSAVKHLIWLGADGSWRFPKEYGSVESAWQAVRAGFVEMFDLASASRFDEIDDVKALAGATALRTKALYLYFPGSLLPVSSKAHVDHFLEVLGESGSAWTPVRGNRHLLEVLRTCSGLENLTTQKLGQYLYHWADPRTTLQVVKIAPGEQAAYWQDCLAGHYICVGWDEVGDLSQYADKAHFREAFRERFPYNGNEAQVSRKANELWTLMELEPGDKVVANRGISEVLAVGTVGSEGYTWRPDRAEYRHTLAVDWDTSFARKIAPVKAWQTTTVSKVPAALYKIIIGPEAPQPPIATDPVLLEIEAALHRRGQMILYGPPGTGKTYLARRAAVWYLAGGSHNPDAAALLGDEELFLQRERYLGSHEGQERLTRITFHPSLHIRRLRRGISAHGISCRAVAWPGRWSFQAGLRGGQ